MTFTSSDMDLYRSEVIESVEGLDASLLELEKGMDAEVIDSAFRHLHSIKGAAAAMGFPDIQRIAHALEDAFSDVRERGGEVTAPLLAAALAANDSFRQHVSLLSCQANDAAMADGTQSAERILIRLEQLSNGATHPEAADGFGPVNTAAQATGPGWAGEAAMIRESRAGSPVPELGTATILTIAFDGEAPLVDLKARAILRRIAELGNVGESSPGVENLGDSGHVLTVSIDETIPADSLASALDLEGVLSWRLRTAPVPEDRSGREMNPELPPTDSSHRRPSAQDEGPVEPSGTTPRQDGRRGTRSTPDALSSMRVGVESLDLLADLAGELVTVRSRLSETVNAVSGLLDSMPSVRNHDQLAQRISSLDGLVPKIPDRELRIAIGSAVADSRAATDDLVDALRLIQSQSQLKTQLQRVAEDVSSVVGRLQEATIDLRLVPLESVFRRFRRVVRDAAVASGKDVELSIRGERTGVDKRLIDGLAQPLTHLVRNAIDHGLEAASERGAAGKPASGQLLLSASQQGNSVVIELSDDGRGIDLEAVRAKLVHDGRMEPERAAGLSQEELLSTIFLPGVTTKENVSELSGRGVGLDAVQTMISRLHGTVELRTEQGAGTTVTLRLPSAMVIVDSLIVTVGDHFLGIPIEDIREVVSLDDVRITPIGTESTMLLRGDFLPVVNIQQSLQLPMGEDQMTPRFAVVLHAGKRVVACLIDVALGTEDLVIKSIGDSLGIRRGLSGASFLGDGNVALIVDAAALFGGAP